MTAFRRSLSKWFLAGIFAGALCPAYSQIKLTGAIQSSTDANGAVAGNQNWNTFGSDPAWNLWLAGKPNAALPVNGPADSQARIAIPLQAGKSYRFFTFGAPQLSVSYAELSLFFDGADSTPGISVFGTVNASQFVPDQNSSFTLQVTPVAGAGKTYYQSSGAIAVLTGYQWNSPASVPGDVCQPFSFTPGSADSYSGWFDLRIFKAASLVPGQPSASPGTKINLGGAGFGAGEPIMLYSGDLARLVGTATADGDGTFLASVRLPQHPFGGTEVFALGNRDGDLGVTRIGVNPGLRAMPAEVQAGGSTLVQGAGFGSGEQVTVYLNQPYEVIGAATADRSGSFAGSGALRVVLPENARSGPNILFGIGSTTGAVAVHNIVVK